MKQIRYLFEGLLLSILFIFFKVLPPQTASNIGGWIGRSIGPKLAASRKARRHILKAMPDTDLNEQNRIICGMWDNLGRVIAEYPHLEKIGKQYTKIENIEALRAGISSKKPMIFISAHIGNWEVNGVSYFKQLNHPLDLTFRAPNNPWTAKLLSIARTLNGRIKAFPKSRESSKLIIETLKNNGSLGILIDQKYNEGVEADFFSLPTMTNPVFVKLAQKYKCSLIPACNIRTSGCNFILKVYPEINIFDKDGNKRPVIDVINEANQLLEEWVRERPEQWIWLHKRWKNK